MNLFDRIKGDKIAVGTCGILVLSIIARIIQVVVLVSATEYFPLTKDNMLSVIVGLAPAVLLFVYVVLFYKKEDTQWILSIVFIIQLCVSLWSAYEDYVANDGLDGTVLWSNLIWIVYYAVLIYAIYKGFENIVLLKLMIGGMSLYAMVGSVGNVALLISYFPDETAMIISQVIAVAGYFCYYLATFLFVPKVVEENS